MRFAEGKHVAFDEYFEDIKESNCLTNEDSRDTLLRRKANDKLMQRKARSNCRFVDQVSDRDRRPRVERIRDHKESSL